MIKVTWREKQEFNILYLSLILIFIVPHGLGVGLK